MAAKTKVRAAAALRATTWPEVRAANGTAAGSALAPGPPPPIPTAPAASRPQADAAPRRPTLPDGGELGALGTERLERPVAPRRAARAPAVSAAAGLRLLLTAGVEALRADLAPALAGDAGAVHRMRTTLRHMRAVLRLFRPLLPRAGILAQDRALRRLGRALSAARDWDVFLDETLPRAEAEGVPPAAISALRRAGEARRRSAYTAMRRRLGGPALAETTGTLLAWLAAQAPAAGAHAPLARPLGELAPRLVHRLARAVRRRGRGVDHADPGALHALRKAVRRLRDAMDSLASVAPPRRAAGAPPACRKLADRLGRLNDASVAAALAGRLAGPRGAGAPAAAALSDWAARAERRALRRVPKAWKALRHTKPFRAA